MENVALRLQQLCERINIAEKKYGRTPGSVGLLAVSKTRGVDEISAALAAGQYDFGENYLQEALAKISALNHPRLVWHFIGPVQSNKARVIAENFAWVHSVDRLKIAQRLDGMRPDNLPPLNVCIQVNISGEASKSGIVPGELPGFAAEIQAMPRLCLRGLMTMPALSTDFHQQRRSFRELRQCMEQLQAQGYRLDTLSMGTTGDMEAAIAEGATLVRIGTAIFGPRSVS